MGTLFQQTPRESRDFQVDLVTLEDWLLRARAIAARTGCTVAEVIEAKKALEMDRATNFAISDRDTWDEQIAGIGEILDDLVAAVRKDAA